MHPPVPAASFGWISLLAGLGAVNALRATAGVAATLKWPNDLLVPADTEVEGWGAARKVGGILTEVVALPAGQPPAVVIGIGINVLQGADELPVDSATSLALAGAQHVDREGMLVALVARAARGRRSGGATPAGTPSAPGWPTRSPPCAARSAPGCAWSCRATGP